jgi:hypothetical protein
MTKSLGENKDGGGNARSTCRMSILECPQCFSNRTTILDTKPPTARCADCETTYVIKYTHVETDIDGNLPQPPLQKKRKKNDDELAAVSAARPKPSELGPLTEYVEATIQGGPKALRAAQRKANRLAEKFGIDFQAQWLLETPWLKDWTEGKHPRTARQKPVEVRGETVTRCDRPSRLRVRAVIAARARFLTFLAVLGSQKAAAKKARLSFEDIAYQLKNDPDFMAQAETAHAYFVDLLHMRAAQRAIEGDCEPVFWQGIMVGHIRKFDSRLQIEMLRAHMPQKFKTPGTGAPTHVGDNIFVLTEEQRHRLMQANRERIMALPENYLEGEFTKADDPPAECPTLDKSESEFHQ